MIIPPIDFDEVYFMPSPTGFKLQEKEAFGPLHFRVQIDAADRDDWHIETVWMVDTEIISQTAQGCRTKEHLVPLEGQLAKDVIRFFEQSDRFADDIQEKVNFEIVPSPSELRWPYHEAGRGM